MLYLANLIEQAKIEIELSKNKNELELVRIKYLGKNGYIIQQIKKISNLTLKERSSIGALINKIKKDIQLAINTHQNKIKEIDIKSKIESETLDISLSGRQLIKNGGLHPISSIINRVENFFNKLGFSKIDGPEIEDSYHNFDSLNIPIHHPARTEQDTFWIDNIYLLRTHTSSVQMRFIKIKKPPLRIISTGKVYRNDYDKTHTPMFHQTEGIVIDIDVSFSNLKEMIYNFLYNFFYKNLQIRFRPTYFPFTKPSAEVDVKNKSNTWLEILGCGMIHPKILHNANINPEKYSGYAFGLGIERLTMLYYDVPDSREFYENDLRFLKQFR